MDEEISSTLAACSVAPWDRLCVVAESSSEPEATFSAPDWTWPTTSRSLAIMWRSAAASAPISSFCSRSMRWLRSPSASPSAACTPTSTGFVIMREMNTPSSTASNTPMPMPDMDMTEARRASASASVLPCRAEARESAISRSSSSKQRICLGRTVTMVSMRIFSQMAETRAISCDRVLKWAMVVSTAGVMSVRTTAASSSRGAFLAASSLSLPTARCSLSWMP